jgi:hypothetical protein
MPAFAVCFAEAARHPEQVGYVDFGESGKNFIEIGKRPRVRETML